MKMANMDDYFDVVIVGTGAAGLYCALNLPARYRILLLTKQKADESDSFLAQGGICMQHGEADYRPFFDDTMRAEADAEEAKGNYVTEVPGKGWQRIVSAPKPVGIVEIDTIRTLMDADQIVISCGGGGIPVMEQGCELRGASAVIEKDLVSGLLAKETDADVLMILTDVEQVCVNYGKADETPLSHMTVAEAEKYAEEGQFGTSSMLPKINAALSFLKAGKGRSAIITTMVKAEEAVNGKAGTTIE